MINLPKPPVPLLKPLKPAKPGLVPVKPILAGVVAASTSIVKNQGRPDEEVLHETHREQSYSGDAEEDGIVGKVNGFTIPGPRGSYTVARVDVICYLPTRTKQDDQVRETFRRVDRLIEEELNAELSEAQQALSELTQ